MTELIPQGLTDLFVYFVPGAALLAAVMYTFAPGWLKRGEQKVGVGELTLVLLGAFLVGVVLFRASAVVTWPFSWWFDRNVLEGMIADFPNSQRLCSDLSSKLQIAFKTNVDCYRFASQFVHDRLPRSSEAAERLLAFSLMARSLLLGIPIIVGLMLWRFRKASKGRALAVIVGIGIALELIFAKVLLAYWAAAVWRIFRSYAVWQTFG